MDDKMETLSKVICCLMVRYGITDIIFTNDDLIAVGNTHAGKVLALKPDDGTMHVKIITKEQAAEDDPTGAASLVTIH